jgi:preprotein translocase subunit SecA
MVLEGENLKEQVLEMISDVIDSMLDIYTSHSQYPEDWDLKGLETYARKVFVIKDPLPFGNPEDLTRDILKDMLMEKAIGIYNEKEEKIGSEQMRELERVILLRVVDMKWMENIDNMDQLRQGIGLRAYGQEDPVIAYQKEGYEMFQEMINSIKEDTVSYLFGVRIEQVPKRERVAQPVEASQGEGAKKPVKKEGKVGRNDPCPCGSGKKFKKCCGR